MSRSLTRLAVLAWLATPLLALPLVAQQDDTRPAEPAYLRVKVPADAKLQNGDRLTQQTGEVRGFVSPPRPTRSGREYTCTLQVTYGQDMAPEERTVEGTPGKTTEVDLSKPTAVAWADDKAKDKPTTEDRPKRKPDVMFVPTPPEVVDEMLKVADVKKDDLLYDLGCGDGIIVVTAAKKVGCKTVGYDIDPKRVKEAKERAKKEGVEDKVTIEEKDMFTLDLSKANVITLYLLRELNQQLVPQLSKMKEGSRIVTHDYDLPGYKEDKATSLLLDGRKHHVYLYTIPLKREK
jgi:uncharacterized protein (TIGR03000 family)